MRLLVSLLIIGGLCLLLAGIVRRLGRLDKARRKTELERLLTEAHTESAREAARFGRGQ